jgi:hypothetical protein
MLCPWAVLAIRSLRHSVHGTQIVSRSHCRCVPWHRAVSTCNELEGLGDIAAKLFGVRNLDCWHFQAGNLRNRIRWEARSLREGSEINEQEASQARCVVVMTGSFKRLRRTDSTPNAALVGKLPGTTTPSQLCIARRNFHSTSQQTDKMNSTRIMKLAPVRAAAMRQPIVRQAFQRQARPFHNTRAMLRTKVCVSREA